MLLKNVKLNWVYIKRPDDNGNFRITFEVSQEQDTQIANALAEVVKSKGKDFSKADWKGSRSVDEATGTITYTAKCAHKFKNKKGEEVVRSLPVYNIKAQRYTEEEIPSVKQGAIGNISVEPYYAEHLKKFGAMLSLQSIQLIEFELWTNENPYQDESGEASYVDESSINVSDSNNNDDIFKF